MKLLMYIVFFVISVNYVHAKDGLSQERLEQLAKNFIVAKNARQQPHSSETDVEHYLSLLSDEFLDEHVKYNVVMSSKEELRAAMVAKLKDKIIFSNIEILEMMVGRDVVFVKYKEHAKGQPSHMDTPIEYTAINIVSLEFNNEGKIIHIRRHHGS